MLHHGCWPGRAPREACCAPNLQLPPPPSPVAVPAGTPVQNNMRELFGILNLLDQEKFGGECAGSDERVLISLYWAADSFLQVPVTCLPQGLACCLPACSPTVRAPPPLLLLQTRPSSWSSLGMSAQA